ncbi:MAG: M55 family metallopeptidase [Streptosporangiaceae bacterium]
MRVHIISDMEGIAGICRWGQVTAGEPLYEEGRRLYTEEVNATVRGAFNAGATEAVVMDCHGAGSDSSFNSLIPEALDPRCEYVIQHAWTEYTGALEAGCDAALLVGMHAMAGTPDGVLSHTVSSTRWYNLRFNGVLVGETGINAAFCGTWGCPVAMVTGDRATCVEAGALLGDEVATAQVKVGFGRYSARHLTPPAARELIETTAAKSLADLSRLTPYDPGKPCEINVELADPEDAHAYMKKEAVRRVDPRVLSIEAGDWWTAWRKFFL